MRWRALLAIGVWIGLAPVAGAQTEATLTGTVATVETKGKLTKLTVSVDGVDHIFDLAPRVALEIVSLGDDDCLAPGLFVEVVSLQVNNRFFGTNFNVYPDRAGRPQQANATKAPRDPGQSEYRYFVTGEIASFTLKPDEKYDALELKGIGRNTLGVYVERPRKVRVVQSNPQLIETGQPVAVTGRMVKDRLLPAKVVVETGRELKGAEFVPTLKLKKS